MHAESEFSISNLFGLSVFDIWPEEIGRKIDIFGKSEEYEGFEGFEDFSGMLSDGIWLRLIIEDVIFLTGYDWNELTAHDIAKELLGSKNVPGSVTPDDLLKACEYYLNLYNNPHIDVGCLPNDIEALNESRKNDLFSALTAKSKLYKAHAAELDAYVKDNLGDSMTNLSR